MPDVYAKKFVYPPNAVESDVGQDGPGNKRIELLLMFRSSGSTGQTGVVVLRPEDWRLQGAAGRCELARRLGIAKVEWAINAKIDYVRFYWDRTPAEDALVCPSGSGEVCFEKSGVLWDNTDGLGDGTGNLLMDVVGAADKGSYMIQLNMELGE